jgi:hypothetical protein
MTCALLFTVLIVLLVARDPRTPQEQAWAADPESRKYEKPRTWWDVTKSLLLLVLLLVGLAIAGLGWLVSFVG